MITFQILASQTLATKLKEEGKKKKKKLNGWFHWAHGNNEWCQIKYKCTFFVSKYWQVDLFSGGISAIHTHIVLAI